MVAPPLEGIRVLDLTHVWAGPLAARFLADLGADVVMVEPPFGRGPQVYPETPLGGWGGGASGAEPWNNNALFTKLHRNRRSVCLDLKHPGGKALFLALVAQADVVMENFSGGTMADLGLGPDVLAETNPRLVNVSVPGFGSSGPYAEWVAFGLTVEAMSGLTQMLGYDGARTRNSTIALNDPMTATHTAAAIADALARRRETGAGTFLELTLHECGVAFNGPWLVAEQMGEQAQPIGNGHPRMAPHGVYGSVERDEWLAVTCSDEAMWQNLAPVLELDPNWPLELRLAKRHELDEVLNRWVVSMGVDAAEHRLLELGVACGAVCGAQRMLSNRQANARGFFDFRERTGEQMPGNPLQGLSTDPSDWRPCPRLGEDNAAVLEDWLGLSAEAVREIEDTGVLADRPPA